MQREWLSQHRAAALDEEYQKLRAKYVIHIIYPITNWRRAMRIAVAMLAILATFTTSSLQEALGHEVRPGFLNLRETEANIFVLTWKVPALGAFHLGMEPRLPDTCTYMGEPITVQTGGAFVERGRIRCEHGLEGERMAIAGLEGTQTDVLMRVETRDGAGMECAPDACRSGGHCRGGIKLVRRREHLSSVSASPTSSSASITCCSCSAFSFWCATRGSCC